MKRSTAIAGFVAVFALAFAWHAAAGIGNQGGTIGTTSAGDSNGDGRVDISDAVHILSYLFSGGPAPALCQSQGEVSAKDVPFDPTGSSLTGTTVQAAVAELGQKALGASSSSLQTRIAALEGSVDIDLVAILPGTFLMGSPETETYRRNEEIQHLVHLTRGFSMGATEVTQAQFFTVMGWNPSAYAGCANCPVEGVNWYDAKEFCQRLTDRHRLEGKIGENERYRLPTEAEWEYACRAGTTTRYSFGDALECTEETFCEFADQYMWWAGNNSSSNYGPKPVAQKLPNPWGLYDMHGNVWEFCQDRYGPYPNEEVTDPQGATEGIQRVLRGGNAEMNFGFARSAGWRIPVNPQERVRSTCYCFSGFRVVLDTAQ